MIVEKLKANIFFTIGLFLFIFWIIHLTPTSTGAIGITNHNWVVNGYLSNFLNSFLQFWIVENKSKLWEANNFRPVIFSWRYYSFNFKIIKENYFFCAFCKANIIPYVYLPSHLPLLIRKQFNFNILNSWFYLYGQLGWPFSFRSSQVKSFELVIIATGGEKNSPNPTLICQILFY